jgi:hypothetical protein
MSIMTIILIICIVGTPAYCAQFGKHCGFDALDYSKIKYGNAGPLGTYPILSVLPDKFARFLFEFHSGRFETLNLPALPNDRSQFDVHGALDDDKVKQL